MISAKLMKELEKEGFQLDFPSYGSNDERIIEILSENNPRLNAAIPLLLRYEFDYKKITKKADKKLFDRLIIISNKIFSIQGIKNEHLKRIIKENNIKSKIKKEELSYFLDSFRESIKNSEEENAERLKEQTELRSKLQTNEALSKIFAPGKRKIMKKIFEHEPLTNTELKYYYRAIRPLIKAIMNENMRDYLRIVENIKKIKE